MRDDTRDHRGRRRDPAVAPSRNDQRTWGSPAWKLLIGVPAHVGGAVAMNAGTRDVDTFAQLWCR